ncbi:MAG: MucBP domain-containing protein, partial [Clostridiales bacterium]|nr:MucBP domain-containing protein [Clostridiales bacterium]
DLRHKNFDFVGLAEGSAPASGVYTQEPQTVTFLYKNKAGQGIVVVEYRDKLNKVIGASFVLTGKIGDEYNISQKTIDGYTFKKMKEGSAPVKGFFTQEKQVVTFVYEKNAIPTPPIPNAGDESHVYLWFLLMTISSATILVSKKKRKMMK